MAAWFAVCSLRPRPHPALHERCISAKSGMSSYCLLVVLVFHLSMPLVTAARYGKIWPHLLRNGTLTKNGYTAGFFRGALSRLLPTSVLEQSYSSWTGGWEHPLFMSIEAPGAVLGCSPLYQHLLNRDCSSGYYNPYYSIRGNIPRYKQICSAAFPVLFVHDWGLGSRWEA